METQQSLNSQNNLKKTEQSWRYHATWFHTILQNYSNQKQYGTGEKTLRSMEQNRAPRNKLL